MKIECQFLNHSMRMEVPTKWLANNMNGNAKKKKKKKEEKEEEEERKKSVAYC